MKKDHISVDDFKKLQNKGSKYHAKKTPCHNGHMHHSEKEAERCDELHLMLKAGVITDLDTQKTYELIPAQYRYEERYGKAGKRLKDKRILLERACNYKADFVYHLKDGTLVVEDCKGLRTKEYLIKRKLMLYIHKIKLLET